MVRGVRLGHLPLRLKGHRLRRPPGPPASVLAYTRAKDTNLGKEHTGNGCQSGYTPCAGLPRILRAGQVANSPLFRLKSNSFRGEQLRRSAL